MLNVGGPEIIVVLLVALLVLGPKELPKVFRTYGKITTEIRKFTGGFRDEAQRFINFAQPTAPPPQPESTEQAREAPPADIPKSGSADRAPG